MTRIVDHTRDFFRDLRAAVDDGLRVQSLMASESASASMPGAGSSKHPYRPSFPGNPPGQVHGTLKGSISNQRVKYGSVWAYGTRLKYAKFHELGMGKFPKRPFLRPVLVRDKVALDRAFVQTASRSMARRAVKGAA